MYGKNYVKNDKQHLGPKFEEIEREVISILARLEEMKSFSLDEVKVPDFTAIIINKEIIPATCSL